MLTLLLTLSLSTVPQVDASAFESGSARSARLVELEVTRLERKLVSAERTLPAWVPLTSGLVGGAALTGLAVYLLTSVTLNYGTAFLALMLVVGGPALAVAGVITGIVFAVRNATARAARVRDLRDELEAKQGELRRLRDLPPPPPPLTVLTF
jgi:VIT1/CCC1 family predicted Fe2+/Mn2+ transporter